MDNSYNPIQSATPVDFDGNVVGSTVTNIPNPTTYQWKQEDISSKDAARLESMKMNKMRRGKAVRVDIGWEYPSVADAALILTAFDSEYTKVTCLDAKAGVMVERIYYTGDKTGVLFDTIEGRWKSISFPIIQQMPDVG